MFNHTTSVMRAGRTALLATVFGTLLTGCDTSPIEPNDPGVRYSVISVSGAALPAAVPCPATPPEGGSVVSETRFGKGELVLFANGVFEWKHEAGTYLRVQWSQGQTMQHAVGSPSSATGIYAKSGNDVILQNGIPAELGQRLVVTGNRATVAFQLACPSSSQVAPREVQLVLERR